MSGAEPGRLQACRTASPAQIGRSSRSVTCGMACYATSSPSCFGTVPAQSVEREVTSKEAGVRALAE